MDFVRLCKSHQNRRDRLDNLKHGFQDPICPRGCGYPNTWPPRTCVFGVYTELNLQHGQEYIQSVTESESVRVWIMSHCLASLCVGDIGSLLVTSSGGLDLCSSAVQ